MKREVREALDEIAGRDEGQHLRPGAVVERAKARSSPLHQCFTWDNDIAGHAWRINEARELIRSYCVKIEQQPAIVTRAYVSLKSSRLQGGGYTQIARVLSDQQLHQEMLRDAMDDIALLERRYGKLIELQPVFTAARRVRRRVSKSKSHAHAAA